MTIIWSERIYLFEYKYIPSRMLSLGSADLLSLVATPCNRTTTTLLPFCLFHKLLLTHMKKFFSETSITSITITDLKYSNL